MKIQTIHSQHRRDFTATYVCEHCGATRKGSGYDDTYYHEHVIPAMKCTACGRTAAADYRALAPKYPDGAII